MINTGATVHHNLKHSKLIGCLINILPYCFSFFIFAWRFSLYYITRILWRWCDRHQHWFFCHGYYLNLYSLSIDNCCKRDRLCNNVIFINNIDSCNNEVPPLDIICRDFSYYNQLDYLNLHPNRKTGISSNKSLSCLESCMATIMNIDDEVTKNWQLQ